jgi:hypothetical protein
MFRDGCPVCGFAGDIEGADNRNRVGPYDGKKYSDIFRKRKGKQMLPLFIYRIAGIVVFILIVALVVLFFRFYL